MLDWILRRLFPQSLAPTKEEATIKERINQREKERAERARNTSELLQKQVEAETNAIRRRRSHA